MLESLHGIVKQSKFKVVEIMTPWNRVQVEAYSSDAFQKCSYWLGIYDYIPLNGTGFVKGLLSLESGELLPLDDLFVKPSSHLLEAFRIATNYSNGKPSALIVGSSRDPEGIITHSDLNKQLFRIMLYTVFMTLETRLSSLISSAGPVDWWRNCLGRDSLAEIDERYISEQKSRVEIDKLSCSHFSDKITIVRKTEELRLKLGIARPKSLASLVRWRNQLVHPTHPPRLIFTKEDLVSLLNCVLTAESILSRLD